MYIRDKLNDPLHIVKKLLKVAQLGGLVHMRVSERVISLVDINISRDITNQILDWEICSKIIRDLYYDPHEK